MTVQRENNSVFARYMYRDHHSREGARPRRNRVHSVDADEELELASVFGELLMNSGLKDGDEFEVCVTPTGRRPHGDRRFLFPSNRPETDDEVLRRIEDGDKE